MAESRTKNKTMTMEQAYSFFNDLSQMGLTQEKLEAEVRSEFPDMPKGRGETLKKVDAFNQHASLHKDDNCCALSTFTTETPPEDIANCIEEVGSSLACTKCDYTAYTQDIMKKHVHKSHVLKEIADEAEKSQEWLELKSSPFCSDGVIPPKTAEKENERLRAELFSTPHIKIIRQSSITESGFHGLKVTPGQSSEQGPSIIPVTLVDVTNRGQRTEDMNRKRKKLLADKLC